MKPMPRVRTEEQLQLALDAPPRPEKKDAGGDPTRWRELQRGWVAAWHGRLLDVDASEAAWLEWWRQSKTQHKKLLQAAGGNASSADAADAADARPAKVAKVAAVRVAGLDYVTTAWLKQHVPELVSLSVSEPEEHDGVKVRRLTAIVEFYDWDDENELNFLCAGWWEDVELVRGEEQREEVSAHVHVA